MHHSWAKKLPQIGVHRHTESKSQPVNIKSRAMRAKKGRRQVEGMNILFKSNILILPPDLATEKATS